MNTSRLERPWVQMRKMSFMYLSPIFGLVAADANNSSSRLASDTDEENSGQSEVDSLKAEIVNLKKQQEKLERRVISEKQEVQNNFSSIEKKMKKNNLRLRETIAQLESNNKAHVEELTKVVKTNENNIKGLRKLQQVLQQRNQSSGATAFPIFRSVAGASVTSKPLKDLRQRKEFSVRADGDQRDPVINDVKLLPGGLLVVTDAQNSCLKLFNIQGKMLHCLSCNHWPACLAVLDTSSTSSTLAVTLPVGQAIDILELCDMGSVALFDRLVEAAFLIEANARALSRASCKARRRNMRNMFVAFS
ncbi:hypothetical protein PoB_007551100 [Plakobranchus ocellatus]|uniref:Uncharacterized protein n=1 Tax=Plakobranchus ocellatus TaxID=259542 RepID=A0AAV4DYU2_9GAST|nr:hypothetical protein PoB_007551100 [Plakobranchus ocellatus]